MDRFAVLARKKRYTQDDEVAQIEPPPRREQNERFAEAPDSAAGWILRMKGKCLNTHNTYEHKK
jgi:hypothetical protein